MNGFRWLVSAIMVAVAAFMISECAQMAFGPSAKEVSKRLVYAISAAAVKTSKDPNNPIKTELLKIAQAPAINILHCAKRIPEDAREYLLAWTNRIHTTDRCDKKALMETSGDPKVESTLLEAQRVLKQEGDNCSKFYAALKSDIATVKQNLLSPWIKDRFCRN